MRLQVEQLEKEKKERESRLRVIAKRIDHTERAYRQEERPLLAKDYELQQASDRATFEQIQKGRIDAARLAHKRDLETKQRLSRILPEFEARKAIILEKRSTEYARKQTAAQAKIEEEKAKRYAVLLKAREEEHLRQEAAERASREAEELERKKKEGTLCLARNFAFLVYRTLSYLSLIEEEREREAAEAAKHEEEARIARMREERERQRAADLEGIKLQQQKEDDAARRAEERRRQPLAATTAASQDGVWRRAGTPSTPPPPVRTPPRSESPAPSGPPRPLFSRGGATSSWRTREQARNSSAEAGSPAAPAPPSGMPEEPRRAENRNDGFQAAKNVWKPSRLRG